MLKKIFVAIIITVLCQFINFNWADPLSYSERERYVKNRLLVKMNEQTLPETTSGKAYRNQSIQRLASLISNKYHTQIKNWRWHNNYYMIQTNEDCDIDVLCNQLRTEPVVSQVSPDYYAYCSAQNPNDYYFPYQYALANIGQVYEPDKNLSGTLGSDIKALDGWDWSIGSEDVVIAIVDSGVALDHEDLRNKIVPGYSIVDQNNNPYDQYGHGTFVASIAAAETNNGIGIAGVSWRSKIMPIKVMDSSGIATYSNIGDGIRYAADHGARVINISIGGPKPSFVLQDACQYAFGMGAVLVVATGNYGSAVLYPAAYDDYCLAVGATDANDERWRNSCYGPSIDVVAPGIQVIGALFDPTHPENLNSYVWGDGTSYASPCVAGAVALLIAYKPFLSNTQVMDLVKYTADDTNRATYPGVDDFIGYGRINLKTLLSPYRLE